MNCRDHRTVLACHPLDIIRESGFVYLANFRGTLHVFTKIMMALLIVKSKASILTSEWPNGKSPREEGQESLPWHLGRFPKEQTLLR